MVTVRLLLASKLHYRYNTLQLSQEWCTAVLLYDPVTEEYKVGAESHLDIASIRDHWETLSCHLVTEELLIEDPSLMALLSDVVEELRCQFPDVSPVLLLIF